MKKFFFIVVALLFSFLLSWFIGNLLISNKPIWDFFGALWNDIEAKDRAKFLLEVFQFIATILGATVVLFNLKIAWDNRSLVEKQLDSNTFSKCIDQLASSSLTTRLGGVFALEKIAQYSVKDYPIVMEVLASFLKEIQVTDRDKRQANRSIFPSQLSQESSYQDFSIEFLTVLKVLERRRRDFDKYLINQVDIGNIDFSKKSLGNHNFSNFNLTFANFKQSDLSLADFSNSNLTGADLSGANLTGANLTGADLRGADLSNACLIRANLECTELVNTNLKNSNLSDAKLNGAKLFNADLSGATLLGTSLNKEQLKQALNVDKAKI